jgi:hypothetical protein
VRKPCRVTELVEQHHGAVDAGHGPPVEQHDRWPTRARQPGPPAERHRAGDGATDHDHDRGMGCHREPAAPPRRGDRLAPRARRTGDVRRARWHHHAGESVVVQHRHPDTPVVHAGRRQPIERLLEYVEV